jgi:hypothetical protein
MFRFTIRDLLWLTVVLGLSVEWWIEHRNANAALIDAVNRVAGEWARRLGIQ